ncbi:MAG: hypothetical protein KUG77_16665 [Nannocystaceae bacterium]|nr:hypothetical protein [Nannocystaceae bacterium]
MGVSRCGSSSDGLAAFVELRFTTEVMGPVVLAQTRHFGGGLFEHAPSLGG